MEASELSEYLKKQLGDSWHEKLKEHYQSPWFLNIAAQISREREIKMVYPSSDDVFRAFRETPFEKVKVVMLGQDPYNGPREANGIAFDCNAGYLSPSWRKVLEEYDKEYPSNFSVDLMEGKLVRWCHSGVLLINSALTVPHKDPGKHQKIWQPFISKVIDLLAWDASPKVFVFLGTHAKGFAHIVRQPHLKFMFEHPASACYAVPQRPWAADKIFRNINAALEQLRVEPIEW